MTKDKLADLLLLQKKDDTIDEFTTDEENCDGSMKAFFEEVTRVLDTIDHIQTNVLKVKRIHSIILSTPQSDEKLKQELHEDLTTDIKKSANIVHAKLKMIQHDIKQKINEPSVELKIQEIQHFTLSKKFSEIMTEYNEAQMNYREGCKNKIRRQLEITGRYTTEEQLEEMLEQENLRVFTQDIVTETLHAKQLLADIEARHADIIKLEKSVRELHDMFMELALLIEDQGELVNNVQYNVNKAEYHIPEGQKEIKAAQKRRNTYRKRKILGILICFTVALIILIILFAMFIK